MSLTNQERINLTAKALAGGVLDSDPAAQWYESVQPFGFVLDRTKVWIESDAVKANPAANLATARTLCASGGALYGIVADLSQPASAVRLTPLALNNTYVALTTYGDFSSPQLGNWLKPSFAPLPSGNPSTGFAVRLYSGDPAAGGVEVLTTAGTTGTGANKSVGWVFNYDNGLLLLASDFAVANPYILGFRYIGEVAGSCGLLLLSTAARIALSPTRPVMVYDLDLLKLFVWQADIDYPAWLEV